MLDFSIQADQVTEDRRADFFVVDKLNRICKIIDSAVIRDWRINKKEKENVEKYHDLAAGSYREFGMLELILYH